MTPKNSILIVIPSSISLSGRDTKYRTWQFAVNKCINWEGFDPNSIDPSLYEDKGMLILKENHFQSTIEE